jgi:hypothetical protein
MSSQGGGSLFADVGGHDEMPDPIIDPATSIVARWRQCPTNSRDDGVSVVGFVPVHALLISVSSLCFRPAGRSYRQQPILPSRGWRLTAEDCAKK